MKLRLLIGSLVVLNLALLTLLLVRERSVAPARAEEVPELTQPLSADFDRPAASADNASTTAAPPVAIAAPAAPQVAPAAPVETVEPTRPAPRARPVTPPARVVAADAEPEPEPEPPWAPPYAAPPPPPPEPPRAPLTPPKPVLVLVRAGTLVSVRLLSALDSRSLEIGDLFEAELGDDLVVDDHRLAEAGSPVTGVVRDVRKAGRVEGVETLVLAVTTLRAADERTYTLRSSTATFSARETHGRDAKTVGAAAAVGAIIGGIAKGGKGAATGAAAGAAAGAGAVLATRGEPVRLDAGARLSFTLEEPLRIPAPDTGTRADPPLLDDFEDLPTQENPNVARRN